MTNAKRSLSRWAGSALLATLALALSPPVRAAAASCRPGDTGVVRVSSDVGTAEGEEPLAANPVDPSEMTTVLDHLEFRRLALRAFAPSATHRHPRPYRHRRHPRR